jgi:hypothetical protein
MQKDLKYAQVYIVSFLLEKYKYWMNYIPLSDVIMLNYVMFLVQFQMKMGIMKNGFVCSKKVMINYKYYKHVCIVCTVMLKNRFFVVMIEKKFCEMVLEMNLEKRGMTTKDETTCGSIGILSNN